MNTAKYKKVEVEGRKREVQEIPGAISLAPTRSRRVATTSVSESGTSLAPPSQALCGTLIALNPLACGRLIRRATALHELSSIEEIFSGRDEGDTIRCLLGDDPQTFIDMIDEARPALSHRCESINWN